MTRACCQPGVRLARDDLLMQGRDRADRPPAHVREWVTDLQGKGVSPASIRVQPAELNQALVSLSTRAGALSASAHRRPFRQPITEGEL